MDSQAGLTQAAPMVDIRHASSVAFKLSRTVRYTHDKVSHNGYQGKNRAKRINLVFRSPYYIEILAKYYANNVCWEQS